MGTHSIGCLRRRPWSRVFRCSPTIEHLSRSPSSRRSGSLLKWLSQEVPTRSQDQQPQPERDGRQLPAERQVGDQRLRGTSAELREQEQADPPSEVHADQHRKHQGSEARRRHRNPSQHRVLALLQRWDYPQRRLPGCTRRSYSTSVCEGISRTPSAVPVSAGGMARRWLRSRYWACSYSNQRYSLSSCWSMTTRSSTLPCRTRHRR